MKQSKKTKKMLISGVLSIVLCLAMLVGSTLAWFTDGIKVSADIQVGQFDVALQKYVNGAYKNIGVKDGDNSYNYNDSLFDEDGWYPGRTEAYYLAVDNAGTVPLNYDLTLTFAGELLSVLEYAIIDGVEAGSAAATALEASLSDWDQVKTASGGRTDAMAAGDLQVVPDGHLAIDGTDYFAVVLYMKDDASNDYQGKTFTVEAELNAWQVESPVAMNEVPAGNYFADYTLVKEYDFENNFAFSSWKPAGQETGVIPHVSSTTGTVTVAEGGGNHFAKLERVFTSATRPDDHPGEVRIRAYEIKTPVENERVVLYSFDIIELIEGSFMMLPAYIRMYNGVVWNISGTTPVEIVDISDGKWHNVAFEVNLDENTTTYYGDGVAKTVSNGTAALLDYMELNSHRFGVPEEEWTNDVGVGLDNLRVMLPPATAPAPTPVPDPFADYVTTKLYDFEEDNFAFESWNSAGVYNGVWAYNQTTSAGTIKVVSDGENHYTKLERIYADATRPTSYPGEMRIRAYAIQEPVKDENIVVYSYDIAEFTSGVSLNMTNNLKLVNSVVYFFKNSSTAPVAIVDLSDKDWHNIAVKLDVENDIVSYYGDHELKAEIEGMGFTPFEYYQIGTNLSGYPATSDEDKVGDLSIGIDNFKVRIPKKDPFAGYTLKKIHDFEDPDFAFESWNAANVYNGVWAYNQTTAAGTIKVVAEGENHYTKIERIYTDATRPASYPGEMRIRAYAIKEPVASEKVIAYSFDIKEFVSGVSMNMSVNLKLVDSVIYYFKNSSTAPIAIVDISDGKWHNVGMEIDLNNDKVTYYGDGLLKAEVTGLGLSAALEYCQIGTNLSGYPATSEEDKVGDISVGIDNIRVLVPPTAPVTDPFANYTVKKAYDFENNFAFSGWKPAGQEVGVIPYKAGSNDAYTVEADGENHYVKLERPDSTAYPGELRIRAYEIEAPVSGEDVVAYSFDIALFTSGVSMNIDSYLKLSGSVIYHFTQSSVTPVAIVDLSDGQWHTVVMEIDVANDKVSYYADGIFKTATEGLGLAVRPYYQIGVNVNGWPSTTDDEKLSGISVGIDNIKVMVPPTT